MPIAIKMAGKEIASYDTTTDKVAIKLSDDVSINDSAGNVVLGNSGFPAGHVIQVVQNPNNAGDNTTSLDFEDITNFSVDITPSSSSNKIFIIATGYVVNSLVSAFNAQVDHQLIRVNSPSDSILVDTTVLAAESASGALQIKGSLAISYMESLSFWLGGPITYKVQHKVNNTSSTGSLIRGRITVMEIQG